MSRRELGSKEELLPRFEERRIRASDGGELAVWDSGGAGEAMILVHGFPQNHLCWLAVLQRLTREMPGLRYITYDLRGHGESTAVGEASWQRLFQDHLDVAAALDLAQFHMVGHDWGGAIGLHVARFHPELLRSLTVLNTNYWDTSYGGMWHLLLFNVPLVPRLIFRMAPEALFRAFLVRTIHGDRRREARVIESYRRAFHRRENTVFWIRLYRSMARSLLRQALPSWAKGWLGRSTVRVPRTAADAFLVPTLLLWGESDTFNPLWVGKRMEQRLASRGAPVEFRILRGAGHFVPEDQPDSVAEHVQQHVQSCRARW